jgi:hypothetical protein
MHTAMDIDDDDDDNLHQPVPRSFVNERRRRLDALQAAMQARHAVMADQTWACLIRSLAVYECACGLLADVAEVEARINAS